MQNLDTLLAALRAAGEHTRLRVLALCSRGELSVSELVQILGQSQPRVSRHLKLLVDAGLLERLPEGAQVYFRVADTGDAAGLTRSLLPLMPEGDAALDRDRSRLQQVRAARAERAQDYFQTVAGSWDRIRSLYVPRARVEERLLEIIGDEPVEDLLDIGTGTGRILEILAPRIERGIGIDLSNGMLTVARSNIEASGHSNIHVRKGDMYHLPLENEVVDLAVIHMVLHYSDDPQEVIAEAARVLCPGGRLLIIDFAAHTEERLRDEFNHHRLGFSDAEIRRVFDLAGFRGSCRIEQLVGDPLTVKFWLAQKKQGLRVLPHKQATGNGQSA